MSEDINTPNNGEELDNIIILNDENGNKEKFKINLKLNSSLNFS